MLTRVKICGLCRPGDAEVAAQAGADYVGVILSPGSPRAQTRKNAVAILAAGGAARRVGVFVDAPASEVIGLAAQLELDIVQLHGTEPPGLAERVRASGRLVWKAIRPRTPDEFADSVDRWSEAVDGLLVDGWSAHAAGGTGARFDWDAIAALRDRVPSAITFIAAGGLRPENVGEAVQRLRPDVVDTSSGVESALCEKSARRVQSFIDAVRARAVLENSG